MSIPITGKQGDVAPVLTGWPPEREVFQVDIVWGGERWSNGILQAEPMAQRGEENEHRMLTQHKAGFFGGTAVGVKRLFSVPSDS